jgi:hypothetical protein
MDQKQKEQEVINNCDAVVWAAVEDQESGKKDTMMNFFRVKNNIQPTDMGYKYNILTFRQGVEESIECFSAIIGDPKVYVERLGGAGYNGMMFKQNSCKKKEMKDLFRTSLMNWGFSEKKAKEAVKLLI